MRRPIDARAGIPDVPERPGSLGFQSCPSVPPMFPGTPKCPGFALMTSKCHFLRSKPSMIKIYIFLNALFLTFPIALFLTFRSDESDDDDFGGGGDGSGSSDGRHDDVGD